MSTLPSSWTATRDDWCYYVRDERQKYVGTIWLFDDEVGISRKNGGNINRQLFNVSDPHLFEKIYKFWSY